MSNWVDSKAPTRWKWLVVVMGFSAGVCIASVPLFVAFKCMHGWPIVAVATGILVVLLSTFILQLSTALTVLVLAGFVFCVNVGAGHFVAWAFAWIASWIGARLAHGFLVDMSWLYHWSKVNGNSGRADAAHD